MKLTCIYLLRCIHKRNGDTNLIQVAFQNSSFNEINTSLLWNINGQKGVTAKYQTSKYKYNFSIYILRMLFLVLHNNYLFAFSLRNIILTFYVLFNVVLYFV